MLSPELRVDNTGNQASPEPQLPTGGSGGPSPFIDKWTSLKGEGGHEGFLEVAQLKLSPEGWWAGLEKQSSGERTPRWDILPLDASENKHSLRLNWTYIY